jgi:hypothetical protein
VKELSGGHDLITASRFGCARWRNGFATGKENRSENK